MNLQIFINPNRTGFVVGLNQTILNGVRTILTDSGLPLISGLRQLNIFVIRGTVSAIENKRKLIFNYTLIENYLSGIFALLDQ